MILFRKNTCIKILALFLALCMLGIGPMQDLSAGGVRAATENEGDAGKDSTTATSDPDAAVNKDAEDENEAPAGTLYLSDIRYFHGEKGKEKAEAEGWIVHDTNLNKGNKGDSLWLAYKTTTDRSESITALKTMEMNGGYELTDYRKLLESTSKGLADTAAAIMTAAAEFGENLKKGYKGAAASKKMMNLFTLQKSGVKSISTPDNDKLLGNYLASGNYKSEDIQDLLLQVDPTMLSFILSRLAGGVFFREVNFANRVPEEAEKCAKLTSVGMRSQDPEYKDTVKAMRPMLQQFSKDVRDAQARAMANGNKITLSDGSSVDVDPDAQGTEGGSPEKISTNDIQKLAKETAETGGITEKGKLGDKDLVTLSYLNILNRYQFDENTKLGDKIVEIGALQLDKLSEIRQAYPLVMAMTPGQTAMVTICGFTVTTEGLLEEDGVYTTLESRTADLKDELGKAGYAAAPVVDDEDRAFFENEIAVTKKLTRADAAGATFTDVTKTTKIGKFWNEFKAASTMISCVSSAVYAIAGYCMGIAIPLQMVGYGAGLVAEGWVAGAVLGVLKGLATVVLGVVGMVALFILAVTIVVYLGQEIYKAVKEWDEYGYRENDIPKLLLDADETDSGSMANVRYLLVEDPDEDRADLNCGKGKRWNALYYTRNEAAGDPICATDEKDFFKSVMGELTEQTPGYEGVTSFSAAGPQSLNAYAVKKDDGNHYLYYRTSLTGEMGEVAKGRVEKGKGAYLADIRLFSGETETEAKSALARDGYKLYDTNVSPKGDAARQYTYIGYKVTNKKEAAVRDIRVCLGYPGTAVRVGDISYTPGQGEDEHTASNAFLCHTTNKDFASPIRWDNVFFVTKRSDAKPGWEPVNLTSGGPAFNWHDYNEDQNFDSYHSTRDSLRSKGLFIYFKPDEVYTEGEEYISGIQFVAGTTDTQDAGSILQDYMDELGVKPYERIAYNIDTGLDPAKTTQTISTAYGSGAVNLAGDRYKNYDIWMTYSTTHNPYRAITDIQYYRSDYAKRGLTPQLNVSGVGYAACETFEQIYDRKDKKVNRFFTFNHAYIAPTVDGKEYQYTTFNLTRTLTAELRCYDPDNSKGRVIDTRGLYAAGYRKGVTPLTLSDVVVQKSAGAPAGFKPVSEFLNAYDFGDKDLGYKDLKGNEHHAYLYVRGVQEMTKRPKYIKNIIGTFFETQSEIDDGKGGTTKLSEAQMQIYDEIAPEQCRMQAIQQGAEEILMDRSITGNPGKKEPGDGIKQYYSYLGIVRTDNDSEAMRGVIKYWLGTDDADKRGASSVKVGGVRYQLSGMSIRAWTINKSNMYALYTTSQTGAGAPVTEVYVDEDPFKTDCDTMLGAYSEDSGRGVNQVFANTMLSDEEYSFVHIKRSDAEKTYFSRLRVSYGKSMKDVMCDALSHGCNRCIPLNLNKNAVEGKKYGKCVVLAARTCGATSKDIAIRDIVCTVGEEPRDSFMKDGFEYIRAGNVSLNVHTNYGKQIYVYYSHGVKFADGSESEETVGEMTETINTPISTEEEDDDLGSWLDDNEEEDEDTPKLVYMNRAPITRLAATEKDFLPEKIDGVNWEKILDTNGKRVNANDGVFFRDENKNLVDNRIYLYDAHEDGKVKQGAVITETDGQYLMKIGFLKIGGRP